MFERNLLLSSDGTIVNEVSEQWRACTNRDACEQVWAKSDRFELVDYLPRSWVNASEEHASRIDVSDGDKRHRVTGAH